ncbi:MAG TPA: zinc metallopeptidase [Chthoniobacterales bacterium]
MTLFILLIGVPFLLGLLAQWKVSSAFKHWRNVAATSGVTGAQAAQRILATANIHDVEVVEIQSMLGDHYDPSQKRLCLSPDVYRTPSVAALGIAAHECGHAVQHARGYAPLAWRMAVVPATAVVSRILPFVLIAGFFIPALGYRAMMVAAVCYAVLAVFQLITLPVEFDATRRAKVILGQMRLIQPGREAAGVNSVLDSAALTYVAAFVAVLGQLLYYLLILMGNRR